LREFARKARRNIVLLNNTESPPLASGKVLFLAKEVKGRLNRKNYKLKK